MNWMAFVWLILLVVFLAVESSTVTLVSLWFAAGALVAMIASLLGAQLWLQGTIFFVVSVCLLLLLRPTFKKLIKPRIIRTNVEAEIGKQGIVTEDINNIAAEGRIKVGPVDWAARSEDGSPIKAGTLVTVNRIEGVKAYVTPVKQPVETQ